VHRVAGRGNLNDISGFSPPGMGLPDSLFALAVLTGFGLGMYGILQCVIPVGNSHIIYVKGEFLTFSEVENALVGSSPIGTQVGLVLIVPDQPATPSEETQRWQFDVGQDFREPTYV
jgi:hypothetical protein